MTGMSPCVRVKGAQPMLMPGSRGVKGSLEADSCWACLKRAQFKAMTAAYEPHGGIPSADQVAWRMRRYTDQPISVLARWIASRAVISFPWEGQTLLPGFQFEDAGLRLTLGFTEVFHELSSVFDDWELATWFAAENSLLGNKAPVALLKSDLNAVVQAARADRFIVRGFG